MIRFATEYPASRFLSVDGFSPNIEAARVAAEEAGAADRATFEVRYAANGLYTVFGLVTEFDVVHDAADLRGTSRGDG